MGTVPNCRQIGMVVWVGEEAVCACGGDPGGVRYGFLAAQIAIVVAR
jgi:hypothetical protein